MGESSGVGHSWKPWNSPNNTILVGEWLYVTAVFRQGGGSYVFLNDVRSDLTKPCLSYLLSKGDSKLEREAKDEIDSYFGGDVSHGDVCKWVIG